MVIVAYMAGDDPQAQVIFDGLWEFAKAHPSDIDSRLMSWRVINNIGGEDSAFDGDADIAYALLLADSQWGSDGRLNYLQDSQNVIAGILDSTIGEDSQLPLLGDWVNPNGQPFNQYTFRPSDYMPAHFRAFGSATQDERWTQVIENTQDAITHLQTEYSPVTGLLPDFSTPAEDIEAYSPQPAPANFLEGNNDGSFSYNAGRVPWRIGTDALLNNDPVSIEQVQRISRWIETVTTGNPANIKAGYTLSGDPIGNYFTTFFVAPMGVAAMTVPEQQTWLNAIYESVYARHENYYEDSVTLLTLLVMTGNYWSPAVVSP
jgi:endo-1,4-beta-D-glucanase Y